MREIVYGTENLGKIAYMERALEGIPIRITGAGAAADKRGIFLSCVEETGKDQVIMGKDIRCLYAGIYTGEELL